MTARLRRVSDELADALSVKGEYEGRVLRAEEDVAAMTELLAQAERDRDEARAEVNALAESSAATLEQTQQSLNEVSCLPALDDCFTTAGAARQSSNRGQFEG